MKLFKFIAGVAIAAALTVSCKSDETDTTPGVLKSFSLLASDNSGLTADVVATVAESFEMRIDGGAQSQTLVATATVGTNDELTIGTAKLTNGKISFTAAEKVVITVTNTKSNVATTYTLSIKDILRAGELKSFSLLASNNGDYLTKDYEIEEISSESAMVVRIPGGGSGKTLVATVTAGTNDVITDGNGNTITDGKISFDATYALDIIVKNSESNQSTAYEVKVGKILQTVVTKLDSYYEEAAKKNMAATISLAINPSDNSLYMAYLRKATVNGTVDSYNSIGVVKYNSTSGAFEAVGTQGQPSQERLTAAVATPLMLGFDKDNTPEIIYGKGIVTNTFSALQYNGSDWADLGNTGFGEKYSVSYGDPGLYMNPTTGKLGFFATSNIGKTDANYRSHMNVEFNGTTWDLNHSVLPGLPAYGSDTENASACVFYCGYGVNTDDAAYVVASLNQRGYYVYKMTDGSWTSVVDNYFPTNAPYGLPKNLCAAVDTAGTVVVMAADAATQKMQPFKVDEENSTLVPYSDGLPITIGSNGSISQALAFGINPVSNQYFAAMTDASKVSGWAVVDEETQKWTALTAFPSTGSLVSSYKVVYDANGTGYVAFVVNNSVQEDGGNVNYNTIEVYKIGLEDDVLPE